MHLGYEAVFKRYELKYMITPEQQEKLLRVMRPHMKADAHGSETVLNLYFDTDSYRLIRHSIEKPAYKEKLRIRSYGRAGSNSPVFVELKKKYQSVVYKRRVAMTEKEALSWLCGRAPCPIESQITREIDYFLKFYSKVRPVVLLSYERQAYYAGDGSGFRITFDRNILCRQTELSLETEVSGARILEQGKVLMEVKCAGGLPLWLTRTLTEEKIYKTSFSKYGTAYQTLIHPQLLNKRKEHRINV